MSEALADKQTLFDITGEEIDPQYIDEQQNQFIPNNPLHYKAYRLQILLARLDKQAKNNPAQFNSTTYINALNAYTDCCIEIKQGKPIDELLDEGNVVSQRESKTEEADSEIEPISMGVGVRANDPLSR